jgi:hypothetical protein
MSHTFGAWTTAMNTAPGAQLSRFWRRRLTRLPAVARSQPAGARATAVVMLAAAAAISLMPTLRGQAVSAESEARAAAGEPAAAKAAPATSPPGVAVPLRSGRVNLPVVVAAHVLLLEGKQIVTWAELEKKIATLPDPSQAHPSFYLTRGLDEAGGEEQAKEQIWRLHVKYKLKGHSEGSLSPRAELRYDRVRTARDLVPDPALRVDGRIIDGQGRPASGAEVILVLPVDPSIPYKVYDIYLVRGRLRNPLEEILTHSDGQGRFALYPPKGSKFYVVALHPATGFGLTRGAQLAGGGEVRLIAWATLVSKFAVEAGQRQEASLRTQIREADGLPEISFTQYWVDLKQDSPTAEFRFTHVPPIFATTIDRDFPSEHGAMGLAGATVSLLPAETRRLDLAPLSDKQREQLQWIKSIHERSRSGGTDPAGRGGKVPPAGASSAVPAVEKTNAQK